MITLEGIGRTFKGDAGLSVEALKEISLTIAPGEFVAVSGPSGSGKSTLLNILGCLDRPGKGSYRLVGKEVTTLNADGLAMLRRRVFGFVFQSYNLIDGSNAAENVELPGVYARLPRAQRRKRATQLLVQLGLAGRSSHLPSELSGGEQQRVAVARALMNGGRVILADEPTGALDKQNGEQVLESLEALARAGHTVILVTHNPEVAARADRHIELRDGHVVADTGPAGMAAGVANDEFMTEGRGTAAMSRPSQFIHDSQSALRRFLGRGARLRTALTVAAIMIAVASGALVLSVGEGTYRETIASVNLMGLETIRVFAKRPPRSLPGSSGDESGVSADYMPLTQELARAIHDEVPNVRAVSPAIHLFPVTARHGEITMQLLVTGYVDRGKRSDRGPLEYRLETGEHITDREDENMERVAVLESQIRERMFAAETNPLGQQVLIEGIPFRVKGTYERRVFANTDLVDYGIVVPFRTASALLTSRDDVDEIIVYLEDFDRLFETAEAIRDLGIRRRGGDTLVLNHVGREVRIARKARAQLWFVVGSIAGCMLLAGSLSVMNIMLLSVRTRRREIGIRMAVGARRADILRQFFCEAIVMSAVGAVIGALFALAGVSILERLDVVIEASLAFFVLPTVCALVAGALFGIVPARRAAKLHPVAALASD